MQKTNIQQYEVVSKNQQIPPPGTHFFPEAPLLLCLLFFLLRNIQAFIASHKCNPLASFCV